MNKGTRAVLVLLGILAWCILIAHCFISILLYDNKLLYIIAAIIITFVPIIVITYFVAEDI